MIAFQALSLFTLVLCLFSLSNKIIGLELFGVLQLAYFNLADHFEHINIYLAPLAGMKLSNGPGLVFEDESREQFYEKMPRIVKEDL